MDFLRNLRVISEFLSREKAPFAVIGGVALHAYGLTRATRDLDFVVDAAIRDRLIAFMESQGFETLHRSEGFSNHSHPDATWGRVDFAYVTGETSRRLFAQCSGRLQLGGMVWPVPRAEHLAAMKIHAVKNDPDRRLRELAELQFLLSLPDVDREEIRGYFERSGLTALYEEINPKE